MQMKKGCSMIRVVLSLLLGKNDIIVESPDFFELCNSVDLSNLASYWPNTVTIHITEKMSGFSAIILTFRKTALTTNIF